ncbi:MAG: hypothetical protein JRC87_07725 [Deltaproteobacteria bacterium]|nr:hypothetical protein [Deltaproteobacteria bacterium]
MNYVNTRLVLGLALLFTGLSTICSATDEFSFDIEEIEKNPLEWGGYAEFKWEHIDINRGSAFSLLNLADDPVSNMDRLSGRLQLDGYYNWNILSFNWLLKAAGLHDNLGWIDSADIYEAYGSLKPSPYATTSLGKKSYKWGKGYAWNPVGFINRRKDPNNPDESLEGYVTAEADIIKSFEGKLQTAALTGVLLPVWDEVNDEFGERNNLNLAAKLYLLFMDTDIDLILLTGDSRSTSYGLDFSRNLATNFEIHGELAWTQDKKKFILQEDSILAVSEEDVLSWILGIRYLSTNNITSIIEYYHNDNGYTEEEMTNFYTFAREASEDFQQTDSQLLLQWARDMSLKSYGSPQPGRDYLYGRFSQKEPFNILYLTPSLTTILNLDDKSYTLTPELIYTRFTNWEIRLRFSYLNGATCSEFGEKQNSNKLEFRLRYFF